jgi:hypothetical protein
MSFVEATQRSRSQPSGRSDHGNGQHRGPSFHHPRTSLGATGHWIHLAAVAAPLLIGELVKDSDKRWRYLRLATVGTALASEAIWTLRLSKDRQKDEAAREALAECSSALRP